MTERDEEHMAARLKKLNKELNKLYKADVRDQKSIDDLKTRIAKINEWKGVVPAQQKETMGKKEFVERFKEALGAGEPDTTMEIPDIACLDAVWNLIVGRNIAISAPEEVKREIMTRTRKHYSHNKSKGYRI